MLLVAESYHLVYRFPGGGMEFCVPSRELLPPLRDFCLAGNVQASHLRQEDELLLPFVEESSVQRSEFRHGDRPLPYVAEIPSLCLAQVLYGRPFPAVVLPFSSVKNAPGLPSPVP